jgi:hypothetical protein
MLPFSVGTESNNLSAWPHTRLAARTLKPHIPIPLEAGLGFEKDAIHSAP